MSYYQPRYKICKQVGENIWTINANDKINVDGEVETKYTKFAFNKIKKSKLYYKLFRQEKILRAYYGNLNNRQFKNIFKKIYKNALYKQNPILYLETRLDIFLTRCKLVNSIFEAKQFILHGNVLVNGRIITYGNYNLSAGDIVQIKQNKMPALISNIKEIVKRDPFIDTNDALQTPDYIFINYNIMSAILLNIPTLKQIPYIVKLNPLTIKQFYNI